MTAAKKAPAKRATPHKPEGVREPQDHLKPAAQREAESAETVTVAWGGLAFDIIADPNEWDFFAVSAPLAQGNIGVALLGLLGNAQTVELRKAYPRLTQGQARELYDAISEALGFGSGN
ncbi:Uncharacterised protein [Nocardia otitidiscaviarum]|uniref:Uncharacterized protein n=2 Tax=Nocardia otitidiscaviarum TaxID=1823 RepID=A0A378Y613_9NOCA|nr:hypothetical protein [Nocardia otitidiscaviarum]SUA72656.1 Uncharacterised protein [Nocardia otitidiscaviarum]